MLSLQHISVNVWEKEIIRDVSLDFELGKNYCILWKNGSGKSSLAMTLMGHPNYEVVWGDILLDGVSLKKIEPNERAKLWIFLAFQNIPEISGVKLFEFLKGIYDTSKGEISTFLWFKALIEPFLEELQISKEFLWRDLNVGFSGGERRKFEILQMKLLQPKYIILDEIDSGLDVDAFKVVAQLVSNLDSDTNSFIIITHIFSILEYLPVDEVIVMQWGSVIQKWNIDLVSTIKASGFDSI